MNDKIIHTCVSDENGKHIKGLCCIIEDLQQENARMREVLEFYANPDTWLTKFSQPMFLYPDKRIIREDITDDRDGEGSIAGNKARQALKQGSEK